ncbi:hypothetical protein [Rothia endophytica]|uniref:hypothetical protein n=1 Tax=Rothia endophytica TaxID=1324766 RepID=UPI001F33CF15|nr:hypothetical protein [Rothia endophytica]
MADLLEKHQVALYLLALVAGAAVSFLQDVPVLTEPLVSPALAALLLATFLSIPLKQAATEKPPRGFLSGLLVLNFLLVPAIIALLLIATPAPDALLFTAALVLLAPCLACPGSGAGASAARLGTTGLPDDGAPSTRVRRGRHGATHAGGPVSNNSSPYPQPCR